MRMMIRMVKIQALVQREDRYWSLNAATTCLNDPTAVVQVWGVDLSCQQVLEQSGN